MQQTVVPQFNQPLETTLVSKRRDWNVVFLVVNVALVVFSYWLAGLTGMASNIVTKPLRMLLIAVSLYYLFFMTRRQRYFFKDRNSWRLWVFILLNLYVLPFSFDMWTTTEKFANLFPYLVYINYLVIYLYRNYTPQQLLHFLLRLLNLVYAFPILTYLFSGAGLGRTDIYGETIGGFVNNHYGWASTLFLATSLDLLRNEKNLPQLHRRVIIAMIPMAFFLLLISGSRSGYLSFAVCFLIFVLKNKGTHVVLKFITVILVVVFVAQIYGDENSALNKRLEKTETQRKKGEARGIAAKFAFEAFENSPTTMLTGFGFYAFNIGVTSLNPTANPKTLKTGVHNSYYELLFGSGILVFAFFLIGFILPSISRFTLIHTNQYVFLPPLILIPFFENNFNPGQFLFFPWFLLLFYYIHYYSVNRMAPPTVG